MIPVEQLVKGKWYYLHVSMTIARKEQSYDVVLNFNGCDEEGPVWRVTQNDTAGVDDSTLRADKGMTITALYEMVPNLELKPFELAN